MVEAAGEPGKTGPGALHPRSRRPGVPPAGADASQKLLALRRRGRTRPPLRRLWIRRKGVAEAGNDEVEATKPVKKAAKVRPAYSDPIPTAKPRKKSGL